MVIFENRVSHYSSRFVQFVRLFVANLGSALCDTLLRLLLLGKMRLNKTDNFTMNSRLSLLGVSLVLTWFALFRFGLVWFRFIRE